jgi:hypothetical protein
MGWAEKQEAVRLAIAGGLKLPDAATIGGKRTYKRVEWNGRDSANRWSQGGPTADLRLGAIRTKGQVERRYTFAQGATAELSTLRPTYGRSVVFTVSVLVEVDSQDPGDASAGTVTGRLRTRIQRDDILELLQAFDVAFVDIASTTDADYVSEGRVISASVVDIRFGTTEEDVDEDGPGNWIAQAYGLGTGDLTSVTLAVDASVIDELSGLVVTDTDGVVITDADGVVITWL